jgi:GT2 family glycosyltransferase
MQDGNRNLFNYKVSFLIMDFNKPVETKICINSIRQNTKFNEYEIVLLSNGGSQNYIIDLYNNNLIDRLILNKKNYGCGYGTNTLYNNSDTKYCIYVQNDQYMSREFLLEEFNQLTESLKNYSCIDLSGGAGHNDKFSERAHIVNRDIILKNPRLAYGGPGPFEHKLMWSEESTQNYFKNNSLKINHNWPMLFGNNGRYTVREDENGNVSRKDLFTGKIEIL